MVTVWVVVELPVTVTEKVSWSLLVIEIVTVLLFPQSMSLNLSQVITDNIAFGTSFYLK